MQTFDDDEFVEKPRIEAFCHQAMAYKGGESMRNLELLDKRIAFIRTDSRSL